MCPDGDNPARVRAAALYQRYSEELLGFIRSMRAVSKADAQDVLQQVFSDMFGWIARNPHKTIEHPRALLYFIARRRLNKTRAKLDRTPTHQVDDSVDPMELGESAEADDLEYLAIQGQDRRVVLRAMRRLGGGHTNDELQHVLYLKFWAGMTETEVGTVLRLKRGAVLRRLRRALRQLQAQLQALEAREPNTTRTSTELLRRWWQQLEREAGKEPGAGEEQAEEQGEERGEER